MKESTGTALAVTGGWLTLEETAKKLSKSQSTIERLVATKALASKLQPIPGRKPMRLYSAPDVEKLAGAAKLNISRALAPVRQSAQLAIPEETIGSLRDVMTEWRNRVPITEKLWLDLDEAAAYSGLVRSDLKRLCRNGTITSRKSGGWKILRKSLEEFTG